MQQLAEVGRSKPLAAGSAKDHASLLQLSSKSLLDRLLFFDESQKHCRIHRRQRNETTFVKLFQFELDWLQPGQKLHRVTKQTG